MPETRHDAFVGQAGSVPDILTMVDKSIAQTDTPSVSVRHLDYIDGFRGIAILLVLLYHVWEAARLPAAYWWNPLFSGYTGVTLFFVLSGFCLYWPMVKSTESRQYAATEPGLLDFARRRAHRLLPPYYIALALCTLFALIWHATGKTWPEGPSGGLEPILTTAAWHFLLLQNLRPEHVFTLDGPLWSLALEVSLYVGMPLLVVIARCKGIGAAVLFSLLVTLTYRAACSRLVGGTEGWRTGEPALNFVLVNFLPGQWLEFALGMWAASLISRNTVEKTRLPLFAGALSCLLGAAWLAQHFTRYNPLSDGLYGLGYFLLIISASKSPAAEGRHPGMLWQAIRWRPLIWLGQISYSVYLVHQPLLKVAQSLIRLPPGQDRFVFGVNLLLLVPIVGLAFLFHLTCERPFMNRKSRL